MYGFQHDDDNDGDHGIVGEEFERARSKKNEQ